MQTKFAEKVSHMYETSSKPSHLIKLNNVNRVPA